MTTFKIYLTTFLLLLSGCMAYGQQRAIPKKLKIKGEYTHAPSMTVFENQLFELKLQSVYSFDKNDLNIGATYENQIGDQKTTVSIYIYPAFDGYEGRLRNEYFDSMQSMADVRKKGLYATQSQVKYIGDKYVCNGCKAVTKSDHNSFTQLTLFECGTWFFKLRITSNQLDTADISRLEKRITTHFDPSKLTSLKTLNPKADLYMSKTAFVDSIMLGSAMGSAYKKIEWAIENIAENERASGFPDIYLDMHIESLKEFVKFEKDKNFSKGESTKKYLDELNTIINSGFLAEFIMEQFGMMLVVPKNRILNFEGFDKWKASNSITIDLNEKFYVLSFGQK